MLLVVLVANLLVENMVDPHVTGRTLRIHPLVVLLVTTVGGVLGGPDRADDGRPDRPSSRSGRSGTSGRRSRGDDRRERDARRRSVRVPGGGEHDDDRAGSERHR